MRRKRGLAFLLAACCAWSAAKGMTQEEPEKLRVVRAGTLIMDPLRDPVPQGRLVIKGGQIVAAGPAGEVEEPEGAEILDLSRFTVLPGLIDTHTHLSVARYWSPSQPSPALGALLATRGMRRALEAGVTTLRVVGSLHFQDVALRDAISRGVILGPRVVPAGHALTIPGGHGDPYEFAYNLSLEDFYTPLYGFITSPEEAEKSIYLQIRHGAEVIKVTASGGVGSPLDYPSQQQISDEELRIIVDTAHRMGVKATAHAESLSSIKACLAAGIDSIDHGSELDDEAVALMAANGTFLIPTVAVVERDRDPRTSPFVLEKAAEIKENHMDSFARALGAGVKIAAGSDSPYSGGFTLVDELKVMVAHEMSPARALAAATVDGALCLGLEDETGSLSEGKKADLVVVRGNPLEDIGVLDRIELVMRDGKILVSTIEELPIER